MTPEEEIVVVLFVKNVKEREKIRLIQNVAPFSTVEFCDHKKGRI